MLILRLQEGIHTTSIETSAEESGTSKTSRTRNTSVRPRADKGQEAVGATGDK